MGNPPVTPATKLEARFALACDQQIPEIIRKRSLSWGEIEQIETKLRRGRDRFQLAVFVNDRFRQCPTVFNALLQFSFSQIRLLNFFIVSVAADQQVDSKATDKEVIAIATSKFVVVITTEEFVVSIGAKEKVKSFAPEQQVVALATCEPIIAGSTSDRVIAFVAASKVISVASVDRVVAFVSKDQVVASASV